MKRIVLLLLVCALCLSLCACGGTASSESEETPRDKVASAVRSRISFEVLYSYDTVGSPSITTTVKQIDDTTYEVAGKVTVRDKYGDSYTGKYDAEVEYNPSTGGTSVELDMGDLYKD